MKTFFELREKHLTPAEMKKREEIAKAMHRENPTMDKSKVMAIATASAKKVAEGTQDMSSMGSQALSRIANSTGHPDAAAAKNELARRRMKNEQVDEATLSAKAARAGKDIGKPGKVFDKIATKAAKKYGSKEAGQKVAGAILKNMRANEEVERVDELDKSTYGKYIKLAGPDRERRLKSAEKLSNVGHNIKSNDPEHANKLFTKAGGELNKAANRKAGINKAVNKLVGESVELDEGVQNLSHARLKFHATKGVPHGSYSSKEIKDEHSRRMRTEPDYVKAKASMNEQSLDEISAVKLGQYSAAAAQPKNQGSKEDKRMAGQKMADEKVRKKYGYSSSAKVAAGSQK